MGKQIAKYTQQEKRNHETANTQYLKVLIIKPRMRLDDEAKAFHYSVYAAVAKVPYGKVTSYGHIAYLIGRPQNARMVGSSLKHSEYIIGKLNEEQAAIEALPWWRVILSAGLVSVRESGELEQVRRLRNEGVEVNGLKVDLSEYGWFPDEVED